MTPVTADLSATPTPRSRSLFSLTSRRFAGLAVTTSLAATVLGALTLTAASADPDPSNPGQPPAAYASVDPANIYAGVGADADAELLDHIASEYDTQFTNVNPPTATTPYLESFDAVNPQTGATGENITTKSGCAAFARPTGTGDGITALTNDVLSTSGDGTQPCVNFARSSSAKATNGSQNSLDFYALGQDAVDWVAVGTGYAPNTPLSVAELRDIFQCKITNWDQVGGQNGAIHVYVNPSSSATYKFFLSAIGSSTTAVASGCGSNVTTVQQVNGTLLQGDPEAIAPYAVSKWAGQANEPTGFVDNRGGTVLGHINDSTAATVETVLDTNSYLTLNPSFASDGPQGRILYDVVRHNDSAALNTIAGNIFGTAGYICSHQSDLLIPYGVPTLGTGCGQVS
jgi:ABC-type phosphate transport system substrate-binding protein